MTAPRRFIDTVTQELVDVDPEVAAAIDELTGDILDAEAVVNESELAIRVAREVIAESTARITDLMMRRGIVFTASNGVMLERVAKKAGNRGVNHDRLHEVAERVPVELKPRRMARIAVNELTAYQRAVAKVDAGLTYPTVAAVDKHKKTLLRLGITGLLDLPPDAGDTVQITYPAPGAKE